MAPRLTRTHRTRSSRNELHRALASLGVRPTPQALEALVQTLKRAPSDIAGDSDALLLGLLYSGSYTVDVLESAGVDPRKLRRLAKQSVQGEGEMDDPIQSLFSELDCGGQALERARQTGGVLETAHLFEVAISPNILEDLSPARFPVEIRKDVPPTSGLAQRLEAGCCELISYALTIVEVANTPRALRKRATSLTPAECSRIALEMQSDHALTNEQLQFVIAAINAWVIHKRILTEPAAICLATISACRPLSYSSRILAQVGADIKSIDSALSMAVKLSPERDAAGLVLFERENRIHVGQYTYRNTFLTERSDRIALPSRVSLQAIRPVSLISEFAIQSFENLVSADKTSESDIQRFLNANPEILQTLGYATARPHLCLYEENTNELIPDYILELPGNRGFDILDLKLPTARLVARHPYPRPSAEIIKAIAQLRKYRRFFDNASNRRAFQNRFGLEAFRPQLIVVIGRESGFQSLRERREIEEQIAGVKLLTYDDLMAYGRSRQLILP